MDRPMLTLVDSNFPKLQDKANNNNNKKKKNTRQSPTYMYVCIMLKNRKFLYTYVAPLF